MPQGISRIIERKVFLSALKLTRENPADIRDISRDVRVPLDITRQILEGAVHMGITSLKDDCLVIDGHGRLKMAIYTINLGADPEYVCKALGWKEFEDFAAITFKGRGFNVKRSFRFKWHNKRWEIDVLALKDPLIISIDCKHWNRRFSESILKRIISDHLERTRSLSAASRELMERLEITGWDGSITLPVILSLLPYPPRFYLNVPIVSILQLNNFLDEVRARVYSLKHFKTTYK